MIIKTLFWSCYHWSAHNHQNELCSSTEEEPANQTVIITSSLPEQNVRKSRFTINFQSVMKIIQHDASMIMIITNIINIIFQQELSTSPSNPVSPQETQAVSPITTTVLTSSLPSQSPSNKPCHIYHGHLSFSIAFSLFLFSFRPHNHILSLWFLI